MTGLPYGIWITVNLVTRGIIMLPERICHRFRRQINPYFQATRYNQAEKIKCYLPYDACKLMTQYQQENCMGLSEAVRVLSTNSGHHIFK